MVIIQYRSVLVQRNPFFVNFVYEITDDLFLRLHAVVVGDRAARGPTLRVPGEYPPRPGGYSGLFVLTCQRRRWVGFYPEIQLEFFHDFIPEGKGGGTDSDKYIAVSCEDKRSPRDPVGPQLCQFFFYLFFSLPCKTRQLNRK